MKKRRRKRFSLTYNIVTDESATHGDYAYHGFLTRNENMPRVYGYIPKKPATWTLRDAIEIFERHDAGGSPRECDSSPVTIKCPPRWITASDHTGSRTNDEETQMSLHFDHVTPSTAMRIARYLKAYGIK
jgi:hypothetical protein